IWATPAPLVTTEEGVPPLAGALAGTPDGRFYAFWSLPKQFTIYMAIWDGDRWSRPEAFFTTHGEVDALAATVVSGGVVALAWHDRALNQIRYTWAKRNHATLPDAWQPAQTLPTPSADAIWGLQLVSTPEGRLLSAYAVAVNETRGIYLTESEAPDAKWTPPVQVFNGAAAGWEAVGAPRLAVHASGALHLLWARLSLPPLAGSWPSAQALMYAHSEDGGHSWSPPEMLVEAPVRSYTLAIGPDENLHIVWVEGEEPWWAVKDRISPDGGRHWSTPLSVTSGKRTPPIAALLSSPDGHFYLLTTTDSDHLLQPWIWDGAQWRSDGRPLANLSDLSVLWAPSSPAQSAGRVAALFAGIMEAQGTPVPAVFMVARSLNPTSLQSPFHTFTPAPPTSTLAPPTGITSTPTPAPPLASAPPSVASPSWLNKRWSGPLIGSGMALLLLLITALTTHYRRRG
ncbi:MAG: exo-alpha-sialidase, partial [Chloroflexi bacterium]